MTDTTQSQQTGTDGDSSNSQPAAVLAAIPQVTVSRVLRATVSGDDFLDFHAITGRVVFPAKISERAAEEVLLKIAIRRLKRDIDQRVANGEKFISIESLAGEEVLA